MKHKEQSQKRLEAAERTEAEARKEAQDAHNEEEAAEKVYRAAVERRELADRAKAAAAKAREQEADADRAAAEKLRNGQGKTPWFRSFRVIIQPASVFAELARLSQVRTSPLSLFCFASLSRACLGKSSSFFTRD